jgi:hypothetical protein
LLKAWCALDLGVIENGWGICEDELGDPTDGDHEKDPAWDEE